MRCPSCGLYHPPSYENCISCGAVLTHNSATSLQQTNIQNLKATISRLHNEQVREIDHRLPSITGILIACSVLLVSAGATIYFITKPSDDQLLFQQAQRQLGMGQYAFAVKILEPVSARHPDDARIFLALARAYLGTDQVDRAWQAISQAQQLGQGIVQEPELAGQLANYYKQHHQYDRAIMLLRPLAEKDLPGRKAELSDLDALAGDEALQEGKLEESLHRWEEVESLKEGSRFSEAGNRLSTIYQKLVDHLLASGNFSKALPFLSKLSVLNNNPSVYEKIASVYEQQNQLVPAIEALRKADNISHSSTVTSKLAALLARHGQEMLDSGSFNEGLGYLQQAQLLDASLTPPPVLLRNTKIIIENRIPSVSGEVWNTTQSSMDNVSIRVDLVDSSSLQTLWQYNKNLVDQFTPALSPLSSIPFHFTTSIPTKDDDTMSFRVYLNGNFYKSYPIGKKALPLSASKAEEPKIWLKHDTKEKAAGSLIKESPTEQTREQPSSGEQTMKELEL